MSKIHFFFKKVKKNIDEPMLLAVDHNTLNLSKLLAGVAELVDAMDSKSISSQSVGSSPTTRTNCLR